MIKIIISKKYQAFIAFIFMVFFTMPILSPAYNGLTIYIHWFIALLDFEFLLILCKMRISKNKLIICFASIILVLFLGKWKLLLEMFFLLESIIYVFYCYKKRFLKYLFVAMDINILFAIVQFVTYYINPEISRVIGPTNIANAIWGNHATSTFTNLFTEFGIVKVSGFSREHGFFNALIIVSILLFVELYDLKQLKNKIQLSGLVLGFLMSLSKNSIAIILVVIVVILKKALDKIPWGLAIISIIIVGFTVATIMKSNGLFNPYKTTNYESYSHRFGGYIVMTELQPKDLIIGIESMDRLSEDILRKNDYLYMLVGKFGEFCGLPALLIHEGLICFLLFFLFLRYVCGIRSGGLYGISILTVTTTYITLTSFVVLSYFYFIFIKNGNNKSILEEMVNI